jgi:hypothetical protein
MRFHDVMFLGRVFVQVEQLEARYLGVSQFFLHDNIACGFIGVAVKLPRANAKRERIVAVVLLYKLFPTSSVRNAK